MYELQPNAFGQAGASELVEKISAVVQQAVLENYDFFHVLIAGVTGLRSDTKPISPSAINWLNDS